MTDDSYHMPICIGIGIVISIGKIFSSVLGIESIGKSGIGPPLVKTDGTRRRRDLFKLHFLRTNLVWCGRTFMLFVRVGLVSSQ